MKFATTITLEYTFISIMIMIQIERSSILLST